MAPAGVVLWLGHHALITQPVKEGHYRGSRAEKAGGQSSEVNQHGIEQHQLTVAVKDRQTDGELGKGFCQCLHKVALGHLGIDHGVYIHRMAQPAGLCFGGRDIVPQAFAALWHRD